MQFLNIVVTISNYVLVFCKKLKTRLILLTTTFKYRKSVIRNFIT